MLAQHSTALNGSLMVRMQRSIFGRLNRSPSLVASSDRLTVIGCPLQIDVGEPEGEHFPTPRPGGQVDNDPYMSGQRHPIRVVPPKLTFARLVHTTVIYKTDSAHVTSPQSSSVGCGRQHEGARS